jgi:HlyD family secretion protein
MATSAHIRKAAIAAITLGTAALVVAARWWQTNEPSAPLLGVVHQTEIRLAPETSGRLASVNVKSGDKVRKGDVVAVLSSPELTAALEEAKANATTARANRANIDVGVRKEQVDIAAQRIRIAQSNLALAQQQQFRAATLAAKEFASKQQLDESATAVKKAEASLSLAQAAYAESKAGPIQEERAVASAQVALAEAAVASLKAKLAKTTLLAPVDGVVGILVAEIGEAISPGQPVMTIDLKDERWFTFTVRENRLAGLSVGSPATLSTARGEQIKARVTELRPLGEFAVWRAARAVGDHDTNSFLVRLEPAAGAPDLEAGMSIWIDAGRTTSSASDLPPR